MDTYYRARMREEDEYQFAFIKASPAGRELRAARRQSQFSWSGQDWVEVEGLQLRCETWEGPAYAHLNLGLCVVNGTNETAVGWRILNATQQKVLAYSTFTIPGKTQGYNSALLPAISGRIPNGNPDERFIAQVQVTGDFPSAYIFPDWLDDSAGDLFVMGA